MRVEVITGRDGSRVEDPNRRVILTVFGELLSHVEALVSPIFGMKTHVGADVQRHVC